MNYFKSIAFLVSSAVFTPSYADIDSYFNQIKHDPNSLYAFFKSMPKGGELHYHLAGGSYPETMLEVAAKGEYCLDKETYTLSKNNLKCDGIKSKDILSQPKLYNAIVKDWSMKDFVPGQQSGHDHFFQGFMKFMPVVFDHRPQFLADIIQRAAAQKELYMEILTIPDNANALNFGKIIKNIKSFKKKRAILLANRKYQNNVSKTVAETEKILSDTQKELGCLNNPNNVACHVNIKFIYYVLREQPIDNVFAQALNGFEAVSRSKGLLLGVNLVQPEDGVISLRDYHKQMEIFQYLHKLYPKVNISLHAGELAPGAVVPKEMGFHIQDAIHTGQAKRIGHGVDIAYEDNPKAITQYMAENQIPVEINLISNKHILNIEGKNHPLKYYLANKVPVVLSTDDEGVLRTDLTRQYVEAALVHELDYQTLKQINRNALTYAFIPGESIWSNPQTGELNPVCKELKSSSCKEFLLNNEKGKLQWELEQRLLAFEQEFAND